MSSNSKNCITKRMKEEPLDFPPGFLEHQAQHYSGLLVQQFDPPPPPAHQVEGSDWLHNFNCAIASVKAKHGDIDKDCNLSTEWMRKLTLFGIWKLLRELQEKQLDELELASLQPYYNILLDYKKLNIDVSWLMKRLDEIKAAIIARDATQNLIASKRGHLQNWEEKKENLRRLRKEVKGAEDELAAAEQVIHKLDREINRETSKFRRFQTKPLVDGLI